MKEKALITPWLTQDSKRIALICCFYAVGIAGHLWEVTRPLMLFMTPGFLGVFGLLTALPSILEGRGRFLLWLIPTYLVTFSLEALGVATGLVFGGYHYGPTLGAMVLEVPVVIGFNWTLVVLGFLQLADLLPWDRWKTLGKTAVRTAATVLFTAVACTAFDWVMEPLAMGLDYWQWEGNVIPLQNYLAWFLIAAAGAAFYRLLKVKVRNNLAAGYVVIQLVFFIALRLGGLGV